MLMSKITNLKHYGKQHMLSSTHTGDIFYIYALNEQAKPGG